MPDIAAARPVAGQPIETAWGQSVHDRVEAVPTIQQFFVPAAADGSSYVIVPLTFSPAFTSEPACLWNLTSSDGNAYVAQTTGLTANSGTLQITRPDLGSIASGITLYVHVVAIGTAVA